MDLGRHRDSGRLSKNGPRRQSETERQFKLYGAKELEEQGRAASTEEGLDKKRKEQADTRQERLEGREKKKLKIIDTIDQLRKIEIKDNIIAKQKIELDEEENNLTEQLNRLNNEMSNPDELHRLEAQLAGYQEKRKKFSKEVLKNKRELKKLQKQMKEIGVEDSSEDSS